LHAGRAGNKGTAITFIAPDDDRYAPDLVKALKESAAPIPKDLQALADAFNEKRKAGTVQAHGTGYGGTGFKFDTNEEEERRAARKVCIFYYPRPPAVVLTPKIILSSITSKGTGDARPIRPYVSVQYSVIGM